MYIADFMRFFCEIDVKINLHCHSDYSDGHDLMEMALAHKEQGFSAFVVTDHVYPLFLADDKEKQYSLCFAFAYQKKRWKFS